MKRVRASEGVTRVSPNGYLYIHHNGKWLTMQRHIMQEHLGRELAPGERVSFIDKNKTNFSLSNLKLTQAAGTSLNARLAKLYAKKENIEAEIAALEKELANETD